MTVEQILNKFQQELEKDSLIFVQEARRVSEYDAMLRDSQREINQFTLQAQRCLYQQSEMEQALATVGAFQKEFDSCLNAIESQIDELYQVQSHLAPVDADMERERAYDTAFTIEQRLNSTTSALQHMLQELDESQQKMLPGDVGKIVKILNQHQSALAELESTGRRMEQDIVAVQKVLTSVQLQ